MVGPKFREKADRVLLFLALNGPCNKSEMEKQLGIDHSTIHKLVKELASTHAIQSYPTDNPIVKRYDLAVLGLAELITYLEKKELNETIDDLAIKYATLLPGIFDVWPLIKQAGVRNIAAAQLRHRCQGLVDLLKLEIWIGGELATIPVALREVVDDFWDPHTMHSAKVEIKWLRGLSKNNELRRKVIEVTLARTRQEIGARNRVLRQLSTSGSAAGELDVVTKEEIRRLRLQIQIFEDMTNRKVVFEKEKT